MNPNVLILDMIRAPAGSVFAILLTVGFMDMQIRQVQMRGGGPYWEQAALMLLLVKGCCRTGT